MMIKTFIMFLPSISTALQSASYLRRTRPFTTLTHAFARGTNNQLPSDSCFLSTNSVSNRGFFDHQSQIIKLRPFSRRSSAVRSMTNNPDINDETTESDSPVTLSMDNIYQEWSLEDDKFLHNNRQMSLPRLAATLGRGLRGVQSRLDKLTDVNSAAYIRLFVDNNNKSNKHTNSGDLIDLDQDKKQSSLTPAVEVLRRIRWDATLSSSDFSIQHYDRVQDTICEANFDEPNTSVKGREEFFVFAIPEHRIMAVKYKDRIVWDKEQRLDCVFGSMNGNGEKIDQVIATYHEWKARKDEDERINRMRQKEVSQKINFVLGDDRFNMLRERSRILMNMNSDGDENDLKTDKTDIQRYVQFALDMFRQVHSEQEHNGEQKDIAQNDLESMYLFSELVALLPKEDLREIILAELETKISRLEGNKKGKRKGTALPELNEDDLEEKFVRGSGAGGQKINKTSSKVLLLHIPTNIRVECQETRSLQQNRKIARKRLQLKIDEFLNGDQSRLSLKAAKATKNKNRRKSRNKAKNKKNEDTLDTQEDEI